MANQVLDNHVKDVVRECTLASDQERVTFGDVVAQLVGAGVERYHADLVRSEKTYYMPDDSFAVVAADAVAGTAPKVFSAKEVATAVRAIQAGEIQYKAFCERIVAAGCVGYFVSLAGRRAVYYGRTGDNYVEWFPGAK